MGARKQDWTIWVRHPHPFPDDAEYGRSSIREAIEYVFKKSDIAYEAPCREYHLVIVRYATRAMTERIAQTIQMLHIQRMHETRCYSALGWCDIDIREGNDERSTPEWVKTLDKARIANSPPISGQSSVPEDIYVGEVFVELTGLAAMRQRRTIHLEKPLLQSAVKDLARETAGSHVWDYQGMQDETIEVTVLG